MAAGGSYTELIIPGKRHQLQPLQLQSPAVGLQGVQATVFQAGVLTILRLSHCNIPRCCAVAALCSQLRSFTFHCAASQMSDHFTLTAHKHSSASQLQGDTEHH